MATVTKDGGTVTSCSGSKTHEMFLVVPFRGRRSCVVQIGDDAYLCYALDPSGDDWEMRSSKGAEYKVSTWGPELGQYGCNCPDMLHRHRKYLKPCKHTQAGLFLKEELAREKKVPTS